SGNSLKRLQRLLLFPDRKLLECRHVAIDPFGHWAAGYGNAGMNSDGLAKQVHVVQRPGEPADIFELAFEPLVPLEVADGTTGVMRERCNVFLAQASLFPRLSTEHPKRLACHGQPPF